MLGISLPQLVPIEMKGLLKLNLLISSRDQAETILTRILDEIETFGDGANFGSDEADWDFFESEAKDVYNAIDSLKHPGQRV